MTIKLTNEDKGTPKWPALTVKSIIKDQQNRKPCFLLRRYRPQTLQIKTKTTRGGKFTDSETKTQNKQSNALDASL